MKFRYTRTCLLLGAACLLAGSPLSADLKSTEKVLTLDEIVDRTNCVAYYQGNAGRSDALILITDNKGNERMRQATMLRKNTGDKPCSKQKSYVYFHRPADLNKTAFLVWKNQGEADDRWIYLPALDLVKRIADSDKRTSFVGSHFFYEDVTGRDINDDVHVLTETNDQFYVLENTPKDPASVEFARFTMWIDRSNFVPMKVEYVDRSGAMYRSYEALAVETIQGYPTVTRARFSDSHIKGETTISFSNIHYDVDLDEKIFAERYLRNPPRKQLQ